MRVTDFLTEQQLHEFNLASGARSIARAAGAVPGGISRMGTEFGKGYRSGARAVAGHDYNSMAALVQDLISGKVQAYDLPDDDRIEVMKFLKYGGARQIVHDPAQHVSAPAIKAVNAELVAAATPAPRAPKAVEPAAAPEPVAPKAPRAPKAKAPDMPAAPTPAPVHAPAPVDDTEDDEPVSAPQPTVDPTATQHEPEADDSSTVDIPATTTSAKPATTPAGDKVGKSMFDKKKAAGLGPLPVVGEPVAKVSSNQLTWYKLDPAAATDTRIVGYNRAVDDIVVLKNAEMKDMLIGVAKEGGIGYITNINTGGTRPSEDTHEAILYLLTAYKNVLPINKRLIRSTGRYFSVFDLSKPLFDMVAQAFSNAITTDAKSFPERVGEKAALLPDELRQPVLTAVKAGKKEEVAAAANAGETPATPTSAAVPPPAVTPTGAAVPPPAVTPTGDDETPPADGTTKGKKGVARNVPKPLPHLSEFKLLWDYVPEDILPALFPNEPKYTPVYASIPKADGKQGPIVLAAEFDNQYGLYNIRRLNPSVNLGYRQVGNSIRETFSTANAAGLSPEKIPKDTVGSFNFLDDLEFFQKTAALVPNFYAAQMHATPYKLTEELRNLIASDPILDKKFSKVLADIDAGRPFVKAKRGDPTALARGREAKAAAKAAGGGTTPPPTTASTTVTPPTATPASGQKKNSVVPTAPVVPPATGAPTAQGQIQAKIETGTYLIDKDHEWVGATPIHPEVDGIKQESVLTAGLDEPASIIAYVAKSNPTQPLLFAAISDAHLLYVVDAAGNPPADNYRRAIASLVLHMKLRIGKSASPLAANSFNFLSLTDEDLSTLIKHHPHIIYTQLAATPQAISTKADWILKHPNVSEFLAQNEDPKVRAEFAKISNTKITPIEIDDNENTSADLSKPLVTTQRLIVDESSKEFSGTDWKLVVINNINHLTSDRTCNAIVADAKHIDKNARALTYRKDPTTDSIIATYSTEKGLISAMRVNNTKPTAKFTSAVYSLLAQVLHTYTPSPNSHFNLFALDPETFTTTMTAHPEWVIAQLIATPSVLNDKKAEKIKAAMLGNAEFMKRASAKPELMQIISHLQNPSADPKVDNKQAAATGAIKDMKFTGPVTFLKKQPVDLGNWKIIDATKTSKTNSQLISALLVNVPKALAFNKTSSTSTIAVLGSDTKIEAIATLSDKNGVVNTIHTFDNTAVYQECVTLLKRVGAYRPTLTGDFRVTRLPVEQLTALVSSDNADFVAEELAAVAIILGAAPLAKQLAPIKNILIANQDNLSSSVSQQNADILANVMSEMGADKSKPGTPPTGDVPPTGSNASTPPTGNVPPSETPPSDSVTGKEIAKGWNLIKDTSGIKFFEEHNDPDTLFDVGDISWASLTIDGKLAAYAQLGTEEGGLSLIDVYALNESISVDQHAFVLLKKLSYRYNTTGNGSFSLFNLSDSAFMTVLDNEFNSVISQLWASAEELNVVVTNNMKAMMTDNKDIMANLDDLPEEAREFLEYGDEPVPF